MSAKKVKIIVVILCVILLSGCWDRVEMEERAFVLAMAIDKGEENNKYAITYQIAIPSALGAGAEGGGDTTMNITTTANTMTKANKLLAVRVGRVVNFHHLQAIVIGEGLAKEGIKQFMDFFFRDFESRLHTNVIVSTGEGRKVLESKPKLESTLALYLVESIQNNKANVGRIEADVDMGEMLGNFAMENDFILPKAAPEKEEVKLAGAGVFKKDKLIGWLSEEEVKYLKWIKGNFGRGSLHIQAMKGIDADVLITSSSTKIQANEDNGKLSINIRIRAEGDIEEIENPTYDALSAEFISSVEKKIEENIFSGMKNLIEKAKNEYEAEFFDLGTKVKTSKPKLWKEIEKDWREVFKETPVNIDVEFSIRRVGLIR